jgi:hypothetical protein
MSHSQRCEDRNPLLPVHVYCIGGSFRAYKAAAAWPLDWVSLILVVLHPSMSSEPAALFRGVPSRCD